MATEYPLSLVIKAVDKATAPLRAINQRISKITAPVRALNNSFKALSDEAGLPKLTKSLAGVGRAVGSVGQEALGLGLKLAGIAAGATVGLYAIIKGAVDAGDKLGEMSTRVGMSVDAYAQLQFAAAQADVEQESFNSAMDKFNKNLGQAKSGSGEFLSFLQKVAPGLANQVAQAKSTEEALGLMTDAFEKVTDPGKRAALAAAAFGKSGAQMGVFLGQGNKAIGEQRKKFFELSGSQEEFAKGAGDLDNAMRETEMSILGLRGAAAGALFPALTELAKAITAVVSSNRGSLKQWATEAGAAISEWVKGGGVQRLAESMKQWGERIDKLIDMLGGLKGILTLLGVYLASGFIASVWSAGAALYNLGAAVVPMLTRAVLLAWPAIASMAASLFSFIMSINVAPILALASSIGGVAASIWAAMAPLLPFIAAIAAVGAAGYAVYKNWEPLKELFSDIGQLWGAIKETFGNPIESLKEAGRWWGKELGISGGSPMANPAAALPPQAGAAGSARVQVDFNNLPRGARVTPAPDNTAELDLGMGYSMQGAN